MKIYEHFGDSWYLHFHGRREKWDNVERGGKTAKRE
jgi:hypothetical protein